MTDPSVATTVPTTVENPQAWGEVAHTIESRTGMPPVADLNSLAAFVAESVQLMIEADAAHNADTLRANFAPPVIAQLMQFSDGLAGCSAKAVDLSLIGTQGSHGDPIVRFRVTITLSEPSQQVSRREQFWDIQMSTDTTIPRPTSCPHCGAPISVGALVCTYCHGNTAAPGQSPLLVEKLLRIS
jgi:hypothetical protein